MRKLLGDVSVAGQLTAAQLTAYVDEGFKSFINNRPDNETPMQPSNASLAAHAESLGVDYRHIPMAGGLGETVIMASIEAYKDMPRPILAFCGSGMRSAAIWGFVHVGEYGVDGVLDAMSEVGYNLEQLRSQLTARAAQIERE
ncbi:MAG: TIGR01244 family sulfur transferase [Maricaulaceae bacterium]